jgi:small subunit ribosomal protein S8
MGTTSDPIADLLTRLRNAKNARKRFIDIGHSNIKEAIVKILKEEGFLAQYLIKEENKKTTMRVFLKYAGQREPVIHDLKRISTPSRRHYARRNKIPYVFGGMGISILSTSKGILEGKRARAEKVGGELLCLVW